MGTETGKEECELAVTGDNEKVIEALKLVEELKRMGFDRPSFNLESPYSRSACSARG